MYELAYSKVWFHYKSFFLKVAELMMMLSGDVLYVYLEEAWEAYSNAKSSQKYLWS